MSAKGPLTFAVLGAGSWGTALALVLARNGLPVRLWGHDPGHVAQLARERRNARYLPNTGFPDLLVPTADLGAAVTAADAVLVVVPSHAFAAALADLQALLPAATPVAWATKGLDADSGELLHQVAERALPGHSLAALSGPSFAGEVAAGLPTAVTVASSDTALAARLADVFHSESFRIYTSSDLVGVGLGGAVKNVLAIATGIADGLGFGANARAGLITRGLAELRRLGAAMNAQPQTFMGLAGVGDLILTCTDNQSRNRRMGLALGRGQTLADAQTAIGQTVEGVPTAGAVHRLAGRLGVEMPICEQVHRVVAEDLDPERAARGLMLRAPKAEFE